MIHTHKKKSIETSRHLARHLAENAKASTRGTSVSREGAKLAAKL
jgi:hypothetical protein